MEYERQRTGYDLKEFLIYQDIVSDKRLTKILRLTMLLRLTIRFN